MDISTENEIAVHREERFRVPSRAEEQLQLWVDRVGRSTSRERPRQLRILGQYAHVFVLSGTGVHISEPTGITPVSTGDCMLVFPDSPCLYYPRGQWSTCWITWNGAEAATLDGLGLLPRANPVFPDPNAAVLQAHTQIAPLMHDESSAAAVRRKALVLTMVHTTFAAAQAAKRVPLDQPLMRRATTWLHDHYAEPLRVRDMAAQFNMSVSHFRQCFRDYTGRSPTDYLKMMRIADAKRLLLEGLPIKQVAGRVGYPDVFYFMRVFKKSTGVTAGQFQARTRTPR